MLKKAQEAIMALCILLALIMIADYSLFGKTYTEEVTAINRSLESYYNAGGNSHHSFRIQTKNYNFPVSEHFASLSRVAQEMSVEISSLFGEVNSCELRGSGKKEVYSLRTFSGLILPLLVLLVMAFGYKYKGKLSSLVFVMEVLTIANLLYLLN